MATSRLSYQPDRNGLRGFLLSPEARAVCTFRAEVGAAYARATAPTGDPRVDPHPGAYRESIHVVQAGVGGRNMDRVAVDIVADVPWAASVEVQYGYHTLLNAISVVEGRV